MTPTTDPHRTRDVSLPTSPFTPLFARIASRPTLRPASPAFSRSRAGSPAPRRPRCLNARPLHGRKNVDVVAVCPFFEAGVSWSGDWTRHAVASDVEGSAKKSWCYLLLPPQIPYLEQMRGEVVNGNGEQKCRRGRAS